MMFARCPTPDEVDEGTTFLIYCAKYVNCYPDLQRLSLNALRELSRRNFVVEVQQPPFRNTGFIAEQDANGCWLKPRLPGTSRPCDADCGANVMLNPNEFPDLPPGAYGV